MYFGLSDLNKWLHDQKHTEFSRGRSPYAYSKEDRNALHRNKKKKSKK